MRMFISLEELTVRGSDKAYTPRLADLTTTHTCTHKHSRTYVHTWSSPRYTNTPHLIAGVLLWIQILAQHLRRRGAQGLRISARALLKI